jgi:putative endonuclease
MPHSPQDVHKKVLGAKGEQLVETYLKNLGMKILKRNYRTPYGEADIVAEFQGETVFVEVKTRENERFGAPSEAVTKSKQERYRKIALFYGKRLGKEPNARFDVAEVFANGEIHYIPYAF